MKNSSSKTTRKKTLFSNENGISDVCVFAWEHFRFITHNETAINCGANDRIENGEHQQKRNRPKKSLEMHSCIADSRNEVENKSSLEGFDGRKVGDFCAFNNNSHEHQNYRIYGQLFESIESSELFPIYIFSFRCSFIRFGSHVSFDDVQTTDYSITWSICKCKINDLAKLFWCSRHNGFFHSFCFIFIVLEWQKWRAKSNEKFTIRKLDLPIETFLRLRFLINFRYWKLITVFSIFQCSLFMAKCDSRK